MQWAQLWVVVNRNRSDFIQWLLANVGGLIVAYTAILTIWLFHHEPGQYSPGPQEFLITGAISIAVAGVSYTTLPREASGYLHRSFLILWGFLLAAVYGVLISMGVKDPVISDLWIWIIVVTILLGCLAWSSVTWIHERGIRAELEQPRLIPEGPPPAIAQVAESLPKITTSHGPPEGSENVHN